MKKPTKTKIDLLIATGSSLLQKAIGYLILMILTRHIDKATVGDFFLAVALALIVQQISDMGTNRHLIRSVAARLKTHDDTISVAHTQEDATENKRELAAVLSVRFLLSVVGYLILNLVIATTKPHMTQVMILTSAYTMLIGMFYAFAAYLLAHRRIIARFATELVGQTLMLATIATVVIFHGNLPEILLGYIIANLLTLSAAVWLVHHRFGAFTFLASFDRMRSLLILAFPIFLIDFVQLIQFKIDTVMLGFIPTATGRSTSIEVANYETAYKLFEASRFVARPVLQVFLPIAAGLAAAGLWRKLKGKTNQLMLSGVAAGILIGLPVALLAGLIIPTVYGPGYHDAIPILRVLFICTPVLFVNFIAGFLANAFHIERRVLRVMIAGLVVNILINAYAIPQYGAMGAASATLASETVVAILLSVTIYRYIAIQQREEIRLESESESESESAEAEPESEKGRGSV